jgi:hypothetical protein
VSRGIGRKREGPDGEFDGDFARGRVRLSLVVLVSNFDNLGRAGFEEALAEGDFEKGVSKLVVVVVAGREASVLTQVFELKMF